MLLMKFVVLALEQPNRFVVTKTSHVPIQKQDIQQEITLIRVV